MEAHWDLDVFEETDRLDFFDEEGMYLGVAQRKIVHDNGYWHYSIHCWVFFKEKGDTYLVFQKRKANKRIFPLKYDVAAAGHYVTGEVGDAGLRELEEELQISVEDVSYSFHKSVKCRYKDDAIINNEFCNVYLCQILDVDILRGFNRAELEDVIYMKASDCLDLLLGIVPFGSAYSIGADRIIDVYRNEFINEYCEYFIDIAKVLMEKL